MRRSKFLLFLLLPAALTALACVTINVYFPEAAVKDLSEQIENAILERAGVAAESAPDESGDQEGSEEEPMGSPTENPLIVEREGASPSGKRGIDGVLETLELGIGTVLHLLPAPDAQAQAGVAAPEISNPAIRQIIDSRSTRVQQITRHKASGVLGESNKALLEVRKLEALALRERAAVQKLVREENADRERMFKEIAAATGTDLTQLAKIQATYAETLRAKARKGDWIQQPNGQWQQK